MEEEIFNEEFDENYNDDVLKNNELELENIFFEDNTVYLLRQDGSWETFTTKTVEIAKQITELLKN